MNLTDLSIRARNLNRENLANEILFYLDGISEKFIQWNKDRLNNSEDIYGESPIGQYQEETQNFWQIEDRPSSGLPKTKDHGYNYNWHGSLFDSIYAKIERSGAYGVLIGSTEKDQDLDKWKGLLKNIYQSSHIDASESLFGFTDDEIRQIRNLIKPYLQNHIRNVLTGVQ